MLFRPILASARAPLRRLYSTAPSAENEFIKEREAIKHHAAKSGDLWRKITFYFAFPAVILGYLNADAMMTEHQSHVAHMKEENGGETPERIVYPYFNKRDKEYPWGPHTLFYNPHVNIDSQVADE